MDDSIVLLKENEAPTLAGGGHCKQHDFTGKHGNYGEQIKIDII